MVDRDFGSAGDQVIVEECLQGVEASYIVFTDGEIPSHHSQRKVFPIGIQNPQIHTDPRHTADAPVAIARGICDIQIGIEDFIDVF